MATGSKAGLYKNAQSASYLPLTLERKDAVSGWYFLTFSLIFDLATCKVEKVEIKFIYFGCLLNTCQISIYFYFKIKQWLTGLILARKNVPLKSIFL